MSGEIYFSVLAICVVQYFTASYFTASILHGITCTIQVIELYCIVLGKAEENRLFRFPSVGELNTEHIIST